MACTNNIRLRCCGDPSIIIEPCSGPYFGTFLTGSIYFDSNNICWEALTTAETRTSNYAFNPGNDGVVFTEYLGGTCIDCLNDYPSGVCPLADITPTPTTTETMTPTPTSTPSANLDCFNIELDSIFSVPSLDCPSNLNSEFLYTITFTGGNVTQDVIVYYEYTVSDPCIPSFQTLTGSTTIFSGTSLSFIFLYETWVDCGAPFFCQPYIEGSPVIVGSSVPCSSLQVTPTPTPSVTSTPTPTYVPDCALAGTMSIPPTPTPTPTIPVTPTRTPTMTPTRTPTSTVVTYPITITQPAGEFGTLCPSSISGWDVDVYAILYYITANGLPAEKLVTFGPGSGPFQSPQIGDAKQGTVATVRSFVKDQSVSPFQYCNKIYQSYVSEGGSDLALSPLLIQNPTGQTGQEVYAEYSFSVSGPRTFDNYVREVFTGTTSTPTPTITRTPTQTPTPTGACPPFGTFIRQECQPEPGCLPSNLGLYDVFADGACGEYVVYTGLCC